LEELRALSAPVVDRSTVERLVDLSPRQALRVLSAAPSAYSAGKSLLIGRQDLIAYLERIHAGEDVQRETRRRERVRQKLESTRRELAARRIRIADSADLEVRRLRDLPAGVQLTAGRLEIEFTGAADLLRQLTELSRAIMNDYAAFERVVERT
jgi:hypothetical protein